MFKDVFDKTQKMYSMRLDDGPNKAQTKYCIHVFLAVSNFIEDITTDEFYSLIRYYDYVFSKKVI